jgi:ABC-type molybdate transport system substrate-binding protein
MMLRRVVASLVAFGLFVCISDGTAHTAELKIFSSRAIATVLETIGPEFEKTTGHKLNVTTGLSSQSRNVRFVRLAAILRCTTGVDF